MRMSLEKNDRAFAPKDIYNYHVMLNGVLQKLGWYGADEERGEIYYYEKRRLVNGKILISRTVTGGLIRLVRYGVVKFVLKNSNEGQGIRY